MHKQRILTALVLVPAVLAGLLWGGFFFFSCLVLVVATLCLHEYFSMAFDSRLFQTLGLAAGLVPLSFAIFLPGAYPLLFSLFIQCMAVVIIFLLTYGQHKDPFSRMSRFLFGIVYIGLLSALTVGLYKFPHGKLWVIFLLAVVAAADTGAYYVGSAIGKRKLCPNISKGKTVEGALGGLAASVLTALVSWLLFMGFSSPGILVPLALLLCVSSQMGDLTESVIKRACGVKDSGRILPGHGGMFDRVDGLLLAGPVLFWVLYFSQGCSAIN